MSNFRPVDRATGFLLPPSVDEWLPERHPARFVVEVIDQLDLSSMVKSYRGSGSASYHPSLLPGLLVYGYATGVFSSRKLERATYDSVAFRFIAVNDHPDHDTIATFRRRFLPQIEPALAQLGPLPDEPGKAETRLADSGYFSQTNVEACARARITPLIALGRERHHLSWKQRFAPAPPAPDNPTALQAMIHRLTTPEGRKTYSLRKQTPEPVFGIIKSVMGFRPFHLRGLDQVKGEWNLVTLAWNMKRMFALQPT